MKRSTTRGSIELLLLLPLFAIMAWGTGYVYSLLLEKSRLERSAWAYGMSVAHKTKNEVAEKQTREIWPGLSTPASIEKGSYCHELAASPGETAFDLPIALAGTLVTNCAAEFTLTSSIQSELKSNVAIPGSDFKDDGMYKQLLWLEAMMETGHGPLPLQGLAVPELLRATAAAGGGGAVLGSQATSLISDQLMDVGMEALAGQLDQFKQLVQQEVTKYVQEAASKIPGA